jgi:hypothetical protein
MDRRGTEHRTDPAACGLHVRCLVLRIPCPAMHVTLARLGSPAQAAKEAEKRRRDAEETAWEARNAPAAAPWDAPGRRRGGGGDPIRDEYGRWGAPSYGPRERVVTWRKACVMRD